MPPICPVNCLIVELESAYQDYILFESGVKLFKSIEWNPEWNTTSTGKVISIPHKIGYKNADGIERPEYRDVKPQARVGDEVIFSYMVIEDKEQRPESTDVHRNQFYHEGKYYWKVDYMHVLGYVRDGKMIPAAGYLFLEDIVVEEEKAGLIYLPQMSRRSKKGNRGKVIGVADGETISVKEGDEVVYPDRYAWRYTVKGKDFIILPAQYVAAVI